jgi:tRNA-specific 2-thiouridylase
VEALEDPDGPGGRRYRLLKGVDRDKDQSYFLYGLGQEQLAATRFPLGGLTKTEARSVARRRGLATADKPESQEICFVRDGDYRDELSRRAGWRSTPGPLVDVDGRRVGEHAGVAAYTVGQRGGLGVALGERRYVASIDAPANLIRLGRREDLYRRAFDLRDVSFVSGDAPADEIEGQVRIRHRAQAVPGRVRRTPAGWTVELDQPAWAPAPGQAAVLYDGEVVIGGGRIDAMA